jgi:hypothetical protein
MSVEVLQTNLSIQRMTEMTILATWCCSDRRMERDGNRPMAVKRVYIYHI